MPNLRWSSAALALALVACGGGAPEPAGPSAPSSSAQLPALPPPSAPTGEGATGGVPACRLPAPRPSQDECETDADCGPSDPCHARACVSAARARPRTPDTVCTMNIDCNSADVNRCACYEGRCALVPPNP
jgi:hypothetical protein